MKYLKYLLKLSFLIYIAIDLASKGSPLFHYIILFLAIVAVNIIKERYYDSVYIILLNFVIVIAGSYIHKAFIVLLCPVAFDFMGKKFYYGLLPVLAGELLFLYRDPNLGFILLLSLVCCLTGHIMRASEEKEKKYVGYLDEERRLRYELENTKARLLASAKETAYLAEVRERNRIAREIHDNVGHNIAGALIQLQAAAKLFGRDDEKAGEILGKSITGLSGTVTLLRETVHNIKPRESLGIEYIQNILANFTYCPVSFKHFGDFNSLSTGHMEVLCSNIREALTNAAKHSKCTKIEISIDINEKYTRLYIKDNGAGSTRIKEGMGLSGMRERVENMGGSFSASSEKGFMIVCVLPVENEKGSDPVENIDCG